MTLKLLPYVNNHVGLSLCTRWLLLATRLVAIIELKMMIGIVKILKPIIAIPICIG